LVKLRGFRSGRLKVLGIWEAFSRPLRGRDVKGEGEVRREGAPSHSAWSEAEAQNPSMPFTYLAWSCRCLAP
jgi:hypothetical protein